MDRRISNRNFLRKLALICIPVGMMVYSMFTAPTAEERKKDPDHSYELFITCYSLCYDCILFGFPHCFLVCSASLLCLWYSVDNFVEKYFPRIICCCCFDLVYFSLVDKAFDDDDEDEFEAAAAA